MYCRENVDVQFGHVLLQGEDQNQTKSLDNFSFEYLHVHIKVPDGQKSSLVFNKLFGG